MEAMNLKFTGLWMPKEVFETNSLTLTEKVCFSLIDALDGDDGCWASNAYLQNCLNVEKRQMQNILAKLIEQGLVVRQYTPVGRRVLHTVHSVALRDAIHCTPPMQPIAPPPCNPLHPYSKEDNKEDIKKIKGLIDAPVFPFDSEAFHKAWGSWIDYRKELKKKLTQSTIEKQFADLKKWGEEKSIISIELSIKNGWVGLFEPARSESGKPLTKNDHAKGF
jgi:DNA-binding MarR family transcriptional regulator